ncbi:MAG: hypothetical protein E2P02_16605 [Acidobacteria bacterium]|nr:MAG: hypothetical protein E2P02_16605 [Acidobacteriota bacterium]
MRWNKIRLAMLLVLGLPCTGLSQSAGDDAYTRYELLEPASASFRIVYDVTAVTPGARFFFNPIRKGSEARDESVLDLSTGQALRFEVVSGQEARDAGHSTADLETDYIQVHLLHPVPEGGEVRIRIDKTYRDPKSYFREGDAIVFDRRLGIKKNIVVLPQNYELLSCNVPSQILEEPDGRIAVSFINAYPVAAPLVVRAKPLPRKTDSKQPSGGASPTSASTITRQAPTLHDIAFPERARQDREIVYFLNPPESHSFRLYHDYTESKEGVARYVNVVRGGSKVSEPSARLLDTGEALETETLAREQARKAGLIGDDAGPDAEVVVIHFPAVKKGRTTRIRIEETYTDPSRYGLVGERLVWRRSFGRAFNDVVLPEGWYLTSSSIPATVVRDEDGRVRLSFVNGRPDTIDVLLTARKR